LVKKHFISLLLLFVRWRSSCLFYF